MLAAHLPGPWAWRLGWFSTVSLWSSHRQCFLVSYIYFPRFWKSKPPGLTRVAPYFQIYDSAVFAGWFLWLLEKSRRQPRGQGHVFNKLRTCSWCIRFNPWTHGDSSTQDIRFPDPCGPSRKCPCRSRGCALVSFSLPLASLHLPWPQAWGLPTNPVGQFEFMLSMATF